MSANNVVWVFKDQLIYHIWYSGCYDNVPTKPNKTAFGWRHYLSRKKALVYAHDLVKYIEEEWSSDYGIAYVEYGVMEI